MKIDGACHCGYISVEGEADPEKTTFATARIAKSAPAPPSASMFPFPVRPFA